MFKSRYSLLGAVLLFSASAGAQAQSATDIEARETLSVLVKTDADRSVVRITPSLRLTPTAERVLRSNLEHYLSNAGKEAPDYLPNSEFIAEMTPVVTEVAGQNAMHFELVTTQPASVAREEWLKRFALSGYGPAGPSVVFPPPGLISSSN
ncbi:hypothetical protein [uncultured Stenotrophomonas sp.]|uniref:hypothetical protein n=1 Tax=uncultured Stenotrophomonas sp. TaxID=165438 RepID=UPI0026000E8B|nr:hypothetical protein [uncultured Stenotrophomonas sp.]